MLSLLLSDDCPVATPRGMKVREIIAGHTCISMEHPVLCNPERVLGYRFMAAEAYWILTGDNRVETIARYSHGIDRFSDDGVRFDGAYGPKVVDQLRYVIDSLLEDNSTRQAVIDIWRPNPRGSRDIPCTLSLQFLIREGHIHTIATMRSSDIWLGWPYDVFNFTMITTYVQLELYRRAKLPISLGNLHVRAGSQHLYEKDWEAAKKIGDHLLSTVSWHPFVYLDANSLITDLHMVRNCANPLKPGAFALYGMSP